MMVPVLGLTHTFVTVHVLEVPCAQTRLAKCQPSRNGRDRPGIDPRCPVSQARLILSRKC